MYPKMIADLCANLCEEKKGLEIKVLNTKKKDLMDYVVICTANSSLHAKAIAEGIEKELKNKNVRLGHREGYAGGRWILLDYFQIVIHIFTKDTRGFYNIDELYLEVPRSL